MRSYSFEAEALTPLAIAGEDDREPDVKAEGLRPPSVRGMMRWWFRAVMGGVVGADGNYRTLRGLEGRVFGSTGGSSKFRLVVHPGCEIEETTAYLAMNDRRNVRNRRGIKYSWMRRAAIGPSTRFLVTISGRDSAQEELSLGVASLWLIGMLSGVGARVRRGFGSLSIAPHDDEAERAAKEAGLEFSYPDGELDDIASHLDDGLKRVKREFKNFAPAVKSPGQARPPILSPEAARLFLVKPRGSFWGGWERAMDDLRDDLYRRYKASQGIEHVGKPSFLLIQIKRSPSGQFFGSLLAFESARYFGRNWADLTHFLEGLAYEHKEVTLP